MSRNKHKITNRKINKNVYNNGLLNMNKVIKYFKSYHITKYNFNTNILIYTYNKAEITIYIKDNDTTEKLINTIKLQINQKYNNVCIICCEINKDNYKGCPCCVNFLCIECFYKIYEINNCFVCPICRYTI